LDKVRAVSGPTKGLRGRTSCAASPLRRFKLLPVLLIPLLLGGCDLPNFFGYNGATTQGHIEHLLWSGTFIASLVVGGIVYILILWAAFRYRRRSDEMPRQFQYHLPLELTYTIVPVLIVLVLFGFTFVAENKIDDISSRTVGTVNVYAFQWGWQFQYAGKGVNVIGETLDDPDPVGLNGALCAPTDDCLGPGLVLPVGQTVLINLRSRDTVHGFYVPQFNFSRYAQPGILNHFQFTVKRPGIYRAQCSQFCGLYHSEMFFHVVGLPPNQYRAWLASFAKSPANAPNASPPANAVTSHYSFQPSTSSTSPTHSTSSTSRDVEVSHSGVTS
jgi:cytochrome c oxidase subunit II